MANRFLREGSFLFSVLLASLLLVTILNKVVERKLYASVARPTTDSQAISKSDAFPMTAISDSELTTELQDPCIANTLPSELIGSHQTDPELIKYIRDKMFCPPYPGPRMLGHKDKRHFSQSGQSQVVDELLNQRKAGFFIECGAADGEAFSNTLFFEKTRNWSGLLVEVNPEFFDTIRKKRRVNLVNACLSPTPTAAVMNFTMAKMMGGLSKHIDDEPLQLIENTERITGYLEVPCVPLFSILLALNVTHVDYFSLDVEGPEMEILETLPFDKITVDVFTIEYRVNGCPICTDEKLAKLDAFFTDRGYEKHGPIDLLDVVYYRPEIKGHLRQYSSLSLYLVDVYFYPIRVVVVNSQKALRIACLKS